MSFYRILYVGLLALLLQHCQKDQANDKQVQVSIEEGTNFAVQVSPNSDRIVFDVLGRLWMQDINASKPAQAITDPYGNARQPSWSPDGRRIAFQAYWDGVWNIYTIEVASKAIQQITDGPYDDRSPTWSPDGEQLLFASDRSGNYDVWQYSFSQEELKNLSDRPFDQFDPAWHPDGSYSYIDNTPDQAGIVHQDELIYRTEDQLGALSWSPNGSLLSFQKDQQLVFLAADGNEVVDGNTAQQDLFPFPVSWLDDNTYFYTANGKILSNQGGSAIQEVPFQLQIPLNRPAYSTKKRDFQASTQLPIKGLFMPKLSPDAQQVALVMLKDLWIVNSVGETQQITNDPYVEMAPAWSSDQKQLAFLSDKSGAFSVYLYNLETKQTEMLTDLDGSIGGLAWSPDGQRIAFSLSYGPRGGRIGYIQVEDGSIKLVGGFISSSVGQPTWSPDGSQIAISTLQPFSKKYREGVNRVIYTNIDSGERTSLRGLSHFSVGVRGYNGPEWSPDGKYLAAISASKLWMIPVDQFGQKTADPILLTDHLADAPSWSGDSKEILYIATDRLQKINVETKEITAFPIDLTRDRIAPENTKLLQAGYFIDGLSGQLQKDVDILIANNRILDILPRDSKNLERADEVIDATKQYIVPGLINAHSHQGSWEGEKLGRTWLAWGITTTRDPASDPYDALNRREAIQAGRALGARIFYTGSPFDGSRIYYGGATALQDSGQITLELGRAEQLDFDLIKTYVRLPDQQQRQIVEKAHEIGIPVSSHELYPATGFGIDGMEHILGTSRRGYSPKMSAQYKAYQDVIALIANSKMSFTPTTGIYVAYEYLLAQDTTLLDDPRVEALMPDFYLSSAKQMTQQKQVLVDRRQDYLGALKMVKDIQDNGGQVVAGTDSPIIPYGFSFHVELLSYQEAGLSPFEVLQTATINAAKALNADQDLGSLEVGKLADLLILNKNPLEDIQHLKAMDHVMINGELHDLTTLLKRP